jgi:hypothetical protein
MRPMRQAARSHLISMIDASGARGEYVSCIGDHRVRAYFTDLAHATRFLHYAAGINLWWPPAPDWTPPPEPKVQAATVSLPDRHASVSVMVAFNPRWLEHMAAA